MLTYHPAWAASVVCVSYGEAFTRASAQIPPRPRRAADIAAGNGLSDTFSMFARASYALVMQMLINISQG